jgi:hypothetical protein
VRAWDGFAKAFPSALFDELPDQELAALIDALADPDLFARAFRGEVVETIRGVPAKLLQQVDSVAITQLAVWPQLKTGRLNTAAHPLRWIVFHAENDVSTARNILRMVSTSVHLGGPARFKVVEQGNLAEDAWVQIESDLEQFDVLNSDLATYGMTSESFLNPLKRLRQKAVQLSKIYERTPKPSPRSAGIGFETKSASPAPSLANLIADPELAAKAQSLPEKQKRALQQFLRACEAHPEYDANHPTESHFDHAKKEMGGSASLGTWPTWRKNASEALRKVFGPAKNRKPDATRSIVPIDKLDLPREE